MTEETSSPAQDTTVPQKAEPVTVYLVITGPEPHRSINWVTTDGKNAEATARQNPGAILAEIRTATQFGEYPLTPAQVNDIALGWTEPGADAEG